MALHAVNNSLPAADELDPEVHGYLDMVDKEVDKCIEVTERLLKLSEHPSNAQELVELAPAVGETLSLLKWEAGEHKIDLIELIEPGVRVLASDSEVRMMVWNLALNAFHAMPEGGKFEISAVQKDGRIEMHFIDNGMGISEINRQRIFDPFFSQRADGERGTGLGLSITRAIVESHGGTIAVESEVGEGSRFIIRMPDPDSVGRES